MAINAGIIALLLAAALVALVVCRKYRTATGNGGFPRGLAAEPVIAFYFFTPKP